MCAAERLCRPACDAARDMTPRAIHALVDLKRELLDREQDVVRKPKKERRTPETTMAHARTRGWQWQDAKRKENKRLYSA